jgi:3-hydroxyacyl-[acyl-carrier-protein] dehydratase
MRFLFVDEILDLIPGRSIRASKTMKGDEDVFQDHFPGFPVVPGVLLTEMMGQAAGKCLDAERKPRGKSMLVGITKANFRDWMKPDQRALIWAEITTNQDRYATAKCSVEVAGRMICTCELFFSFVPYERFSPDYRDEVLESFLLRNKGPGGTNR